MRRSLSQVDIGSGQGTDAIFLADRGYRVTALTMPFAGENFDSIVERGCFDHIA